MLKKLSLNNILLQNIESKMSGGIRKLKKKNYNDKNQ